MWESGKDLSVLYLALSVKPEQQSWWILGSVWPYNNKGGVTGRVHREVVFQSSRLQCQTSKG